MRDIFNLEYWINEETILILEEILSFFDKQTNLESKENWSSKKEQ
jgi:hypothetical protein